MCVAAVEPTPRTDSSCMCGGACTCLPDGKQFEAERPIPDLAAERAHDLHHQVDRARDIFTGIVFRRESVESLRAATSQLTGRDVEIDHVIPIGTAGPGVFTIAADRRLLGTVRIALDGGPLTEEACAIAQEAAIAAAMLYLTNRSDLTPVVAAEDSTSTVVAPEDAWPASWLASRTFEGAHPYLTIALTIDGGEEGASAATTIEVARHAIDRALHGRRIAAFVSNDGSEFVLVIPVKDRGLAKATRRMVTEDVGSFVRLSGPRFKINVGLTNLAEDGQAVPQRVAEALMAARIGRVLDGPDAVTTFKDLRAIPAMVEAVARDDDSAFGELHERYLGALVRYEARTGLPLLETLQVLFDENGNVSGAARSLGINRQSLLYRLRKIETMCEVDLGDPSDRFALELAVRSWVVRWAIQLAGTPPTQGLEAS